MADVTAVLRSWLDSELQREPVMATDLGVTGYDDHLGDFSAARFEAQAQIDRHWAGHLDQLPLAEVPLADRIDVTVVLATLAGRAAMDDWKAWRRDPSLYLDNCIEGVYSLFFHRLRPEAELVAAAVARLGQVPLVLSAARANLDAELAPPLLVKRAARSCTGAITYFRDLLGHEVADDRLRGDLVTAAQAAAVALEDFAAFLDALGERARGDWAIGEARYTTLLRQRELLSYGAPEVNRRGRAAWSDIDAEMAQLAKRIDPGASGWSEVVAALAEEHPDSPEAMLAAYERCTAEARRFVIDRGLMTLPEGEDCVVVPSPVFLRPVLAVASYGAPPPFSASARGHFFVPYPPPGESPTALDERLADNGFHSIPTVTVHEAYPGHHWQLTWAAANPRPIRKVVKTPYFIEGWALYAESMMRSQGYFVDPRQELCHLGARIFRAARMVVDTALHSGEMTVAEGVEHMTTHAGLHPAVARAEIDRYCALPTQASSYLTGALEIERLQRRWMSDHRGDLRAFHDAVAASPGLPLPLVELDLWPPQQVASR